MEWIYMAEKKIVIGYFCYNEMSKYMLMKYRPIYTLYAAQTTNILYKDSSVN